MSECIRSGEYVGAADCAHFLLRQELIFRLAAIEEMDPLRWEEGGFVAAAAAETSNRRGG